MKEIFVQLAGYNTWANGLLLAAVEGLTEEQQNTEIKSSFASLHKTVLHMLDAESIWWQRLKLQERIERPSVNFSGKFSDLHHQLLVQNKRWQEWIASAAEHQLQHEFIYRNLKKQRFKQTVYQMLLHMFNHSTYHRGQIVTLLRQLGVEKIPATDFIVWSRKK
ncbi:MAG TPA: DinB family protein [Flavisolibacter sp.]|jgi:uncharacterized damage-inducible protein DinB|nr:DinB family protein [Flavisolibacter sp.]